MIDRTTLYKLWNEGLGLQHYFSKVCAITAFQLFLMYSTVLLVKPNVFFSRLVTLKWIVHTAEITVEWHESSIVG